MVSMAAEKSFHRTTRIERPREAVWAFMTDFGNAPKWITGVEQSSQISPGPMGPGARFKETRTIGRRSETYEIEVREYDPPRRYAAAAQAGKAEFVYSFDLAASAAGTEVTMVATARGKGLFARLFIGIGMRFMEKIDGDQLERLKAAVEGSAKRA